MKCLSIMQPWATYILEFGKDVENRTWDTKYRGPFLVHASKRMDGAPEKGIVYGECTAPDLPVGYFVRGHILGVVDLVDCVENHPSRWAAREQYQFVLANPRRIKLPIPFSGSLGLFDVTTFKLVDGVLYRGNTVIPYHDGKSAGRCLDTLPKSAKYDAVKAAVLADGGFTIFDAAKKPKYFKELHLDPEVVVESLGYPNYSIRRSS
jgi:hypothetical protein